MKKACLSDICSITMGQSPDSSTYNDNGNGLPFFQGNADFGNRNPHVRVWCSEPKKIAHQDDILISVRAPIGALNIANQECCIGRGLAALSVKPEYCLQEYLWYYLCNAVDELNAKGTGSTFKAINKNVLAELSVRLFDLKVQQRIVLSLNKLTELINQSKRSISKLDELVKSRFVELFSSDYPEYTLLDLCNIIDYRGKTPEKVESGLPFITAKNVKMHYMSLVPREYISKETYDKVMVRGFPKEGDVVFTTEAPLGNVCRIPHFNSEFYIGQRIVTLQTEKLEPIYLEYALTSDSFIKKYRNKSSGSTVTGIRVRLLEQLTIPVPPINLQTQFADFVTKVEQQKTIAQKSIDKLETLKKSLMQEYFG